MAKGDQSKTSWLKNEVKTWIEEGIINEDQGFSIISKYTSPKKTVTHETSSRFITVVAIMGSSLLGIGVLLFIASNWNGISKIVKLTLIFGSILLSNHFGFKSRFEKKNYPKVGGALLLLGGILYGAGLWLIAQIYNIRAHFPNGVLAWGVGVLPMGYALAYNPLITLGLLILTIWAGLETGSRYATQPSGFLTGIIFGYGLLIYSIGIIHAQVKKIQSFSLNYKALGSTIILFTSFLLTFLDKTSTSLLETYSNPINFYLGYLIVPVSALIFSFCALYFTKLNRNLLQIEVFILIPIFILFTVFNVVQLEGTIFRFLFNSIFLFGIVGVTYLGYISRQSALINIGLIFFVLEAFARYVDFFWDFLPRSIFLMLGGMILLFGGLKLERKRKEIIRGLEEI